MHRKLWMTLAVSLALVATLLMALSVAANPSAPGSDPGSSFVGPVNDVKTGPAGRTPAAKPLDQPNPKDYLRNQQRMQLLEAGQTAEAAALSLAADDRILVILVEFAGADTLTWKPGDRWDPLGKADPNEAVLNANGNVVVGDCSKIITQTKTFTYSGPLHNQIPRPLSEADRSGQSIWTEDFSNGWFNAFMFGGGVKFQYTRQDGSVVNEDFTGKSVNQYFQDMSNGQYNIRGDVIGWLPLAHSTWWYGADKCPGNRSGMTSGAGSDSGIPGAGSTKSLVKDALDAVNAISNTIPGFDWKNYDQNGDGVIDRLWIVHAGYGEEDGADLLNRTDYSEAANWSHSSSVSPLYPVSADVKAGPYIMMPENGGIGVFAHEYAHNLGAMDLYAYGYGENSAGFWALQDDDWTGYPIGFQPPAVDPMHLDWWGWLNPLVVSDPGQVYQVTLGQTSAFPGGDGVYRGAKIQLPDGVLPLSVPIWQGTHYWWGGKQDQANGMMTTKAPVAIPAGATDATLAFDLVYDVEDQWDFMWVQVSEDGTTWKTLTNANTVCTHNPAWIGGLNGFPEDLCAAGIGGFTNYNANWPAPQKQVFDLKNYAGKQVWLRLWYMTDWGTTYTGVFVDNVKVAAGGVTLFADDADSGAANWTYAAPWVVSDGTLTFKHNFYLQWRNVSKTGGYDSALGDSRWRFGPANTGLLVWYNNNFYSDNEVFNYLTDAQSFGPKGKMLVVDAHPEPYRYPDLVAAGYNNEAGNLTSRGQMRDAPFSLQDSVTFKNKDPYGWANIPDPKWYQYAGRSAVSSFHDAMGYYPGAENVPGGPVGQTSNRWMTKQWDASVVMPAKATYGVKAPGYNGADRFRFDCALNAAGQVLCYSYASGLGIPGGTGNPGDIAAQYGWHVQILSQTEQTATLKIWNAQKDADLAFAADKTEAQPGDQLKYTFNLKQNWGSPLDLFACAPLDPALETYVPGSATGDGVPLPMPCEAAATMAAQQPNFMTNMATAAAFDVRAIGWTANVPTAGQGSFSFKVQLKPAAGVQGQLAGEVALYDQGQPWRDVAAPVVTVKPPVVYNTPVTDLFGAAQDSFIDGGLPNSNYGGWGQLFVRSDDLVRSLYQFDLSSINPLYPVDKATLSVYVDGYSGGGSPAKLQAFEVATAWNQGTVTWKLPWTLAGGDFVGAAAGSAAIVKEDVGTWKQIDITALVQKWVAAPTANHGALIRLREFTSFTGYRLTSSKYWVPSNRPKLEVQYRKP